jgi:hypothetical protein
VTCIQQALAAAGLAGVGVHTVDSFQGSEAHVCICSFVRSNSRQLVGFVKHCQRLNVALTRARHVLVAGAYSICSLGCSARRVSRRHHRPQRVFIALMYRHPAWRGVLQWGTRQRWRRVSRRSCGS